MYLTRSCSADLLISCTFVHTSIRPTPDSTLHSDIILDLKPPPSSTTWNHGVLSISANALVSLVQQALQSGGQRPAWLLSAFAEPSGISVSTLRVADFSSRMEDPTYGYRHVGLLSSILAEGQQSVASQFPRIFAIDVPNLQNQDFERIWRPLGVDPSCHFIAVLCAVDKSDQPLLCECNLPITIRPQLLIVYCTLQSKSILKLRLLHNRSMSLH